MAGRARLRFTIIIIVSCIALPGFSQSTTRNPCYDNAIQALEKLPALYRENKRTQVDSVLGSWERNCGKTRYSMRLRTLLSLADGKFNSFDFDYSYYRSLLDYLEDERFKLLMDSVHENPRELYIEYFGSPDIQFDYTRFTKELATQLQPKYAGLPPCSAERMLLDAYAGDLHGFFQQLHEPGCQSVPANYYHDQVKAIEKKSLVDALIYTGAWIPYGRNKLLGNHPLFGFSFGVGKKRMIFDITLEFRFLQSKEIYLVHVQGVPTSTNHFFGGYVAVDVGYELIRKKRSGLYAVGGIGWDGFDTVESDPKQNIEGQSIGGLNLNAGLGWRLFARDGSYTGLEVRHNFVQYKNPGGTTFDGNTVTIRLLLGLLKNDRRARDMNRLTNLTTY